MRFLTSFAAGLLAAPCIAAADSDIYPGEHWEKVSNVEKAGWSSAGLEAFRRELARTRTAG